MEFVVAGNQVECVRFEEGAGGEARSPRIVARFDAHLDSVAPHVASRLTLEEVGQLEAWLADRRNIRSTPARRALLESIPGLLGQAEQVIREDGEVAAGLLPSLEESVSRFTEALGGLEAAAGKDPSDTDEMRDSEVLKERLDVIRNKL